MLRAHRFLKSLRHRTFIAKQKKRVAASQDVRIGRFHRLDDSAASIDASDEIRVFEAPVFGLDMVDHTADCQI